MNRSAFMPLLLACVTGPLLSQPAQAASDEPLSMEIHGLTRGYVVYNHQTEAPGQSARGFDMLRHTEFELEAAAQLDSGTEVGVVLEFDAKREELETDKSYLYAQGQWGRADFGSHNGVAYRLQVSVPAADNNIDGPRQYIRPTNYNLAPAIFAPLADYDLEYAHDTSASTDKISYINPVFSGFQLGMSYTPDTVAESFEGHQESTKPSRGLLGVTTDNVAGEYGSAYDIAGRYETSWRAIDLALGAGYVGVHHERSDATETDLHSWNAGLNLRYNHASFGVSYSENDNGLRLDHETRILVIGASYDAGPWNFSASYYNRDDENFSGGNALGTDRYSIGTSYKYGPGMTWRGSVHHIEHEAGTDSMDSTSLLLGTQINF